MSKNNLGEDSKMEERYRRVVQGVRRVTTVEVIKIVVYVALIGTLLLWICLPEHW